MNPAWVIAAEWGLKGLARLRQLTDKGTDRIEALMG